jgi:LPS sulfotransferase NodH
LNQYINIKFQEGPVNEFGVNGCQTEDVIAVLIARLIALNVGDYATRETSLARTALEEAENWLDRRTRDRRWRGVEGSSLP